MNSLARWGKAEERNSKAWLELPNTTHLLISFFTFRKQGRESRDGEEREKRGGGGRGEKGKEEAGDMVKIG